MNNIDTEWDSSDLWSIPAIHAECSTYFSASPQYQPRPQLLSIGSELTTGDTNY